MIGEHEGVSGVTMPLSAHLRELRTRLMWTFIVVGIGAIAAFGVGNRIIEVLLVPFPNDVQVVQIDLLEGIRVRMKIALLGGIVIAFPMILYQTVMFVRPALTRPEKAFLYASLPITSGLFIIGIFFAFFVPIPVMMQVLPGFLGELAEPQIRVESIVGTTVWLIFAMGLLFEIPIVMYLLARIDIIDPASLRTKRRGAILLSFVAAAIITPTGDPINMVIWALPIWILYEAGLLLARLAAWQRKRAAPSFNAK